MITVADSCSLSLMEALRDSEKSSNCVMAAAITITMPTIVLIGLTNYHTFSSYYLGNGEQ